MVCPKLTYPNICQRNNINQSKNSATKPVAIKISFFFFFLKTHRDVFSVLSFRCVCVCFLWFEGMSCYRSSSFSWRRRRGASTSLPAATGASVCSDDLTTASSLKSGLLLQRPSSSLVTSVSTAL